MEHPRPQWITQLQLRPAALDFGDADAASAGHWWNGHGAHPVITDEWAMKLYLLQQMARSGWRVYSFGAIQITRRTAN